MTQPSSQQEEDVGTVIVARGHVGWGQGHEAGVRNHLAASLSTVSGDLLLDVAVPEY